MRHPIPFRLSPLALLLVLASPQVRAQSLGAALATADRTNPQLQAARARLRVTDEGVPQALSGWRPHVEVAAQSGSAVRENTIDLKYQPEHLTPQAYQLEVTQNLYTSGRVQAEVKQAREQVEVTRALLSAVENDVLLAAATAYADVVQDRAIVALQDKQVAVLAHTVHASDVEVRAGEITEADRDQAAARLANQRASDAAAIAQEQAAEARFEQQIGVDPSTDVALPSKPLQVPDTQAAALSAAYDANPALVAARQAMLVSRLGVDIETDRLLPLVALHGLIERLREYEYESHAQRQDRAQVTVELTMPLYQGGLLYSKIRQAKEENLRTQDLVDQEWRQARASTLTAWALLEAARVEIGQREAAVATDAVAERGIAAQQHVGARTIVDVLVAEQDTLASEVGLVIAKHDELTASAMLLAATGRLQRLGGSSYDPDVHFRDVRERWAGTAPPAGEAVIPRGNIKLPPP